jgi:hypothetical protein
MSDKTYTVRLTGDRDKTVERGLTWAQADHMMTKAFQYGAKVDWAEEVAQCPEDCDEGCYDEANFALAHGSELEGF